MEPSGGPRVAFVVVTKGLDCPTGEVHRPSGARYTRDAIRGMLQFMGCKPRHACKAAQLVFQKLEQFALEGTRKYRHGARQLWAVGQHEEGVAFVAMPRSEFYELVCNTLTEYNYKYAPSSDEIKAACSLKERRRHIIVLLCGTSGSGKSTLASILANRLGISTVLSTDSVRHMMRSFTSVEEAPLLFASTYEAGEALRKQQALNEARHQQHHHQHQQMHSPHPAQAPQQDPGKLALECSSASGLPCAASGCVTGAGAAAGAAAGAGEGPEGGAATAPLPSPPVHAHDLVIRGYKAQCELVSEQLEQLICGFEARRQSLVVEGVHLHVGLVMRLLQRHPGVVPFLVYIKSEGKHIERMAVRAKYMTLDPNKNKYVKNMLNIRSIQDYLLRKAEKHAIPCVENTNIDRSVGLIHLTLLGCLKRMMKGEQVLDAGSSTVRMLHNEYTAVIETLAGSAVVPSAAGAPLSAAVATTTATAAAATVACGTGLAGGSLHRESSTGWQPPAPPPARVLGSPRVFGRESAPSAPSSGPGGLRTLSGDGSGGGGAWGAGLGGEALAVPGQRAALHHHSGSQVELPPGMLPLAGAGSGSGSAVAGIVSSSPQVQQGRTDRWDSCSSPREQLSATLPVGGGGLMSPLRPSAPASPKQHGGAPHDSGGFGGGRASASGGSSPAGSSAFLNVPAFGSTFYFSEPPLAGDVFASDAAGGQSAAAAAAAQQLLSEVLGQGLGLGMQAWPLGAGPEAAAADPVAGAAAAAAGSLGYDATPVYDMAARAAGRIEAASPSRPASDAAPSPPARGVALLSQLLQDVAVAAGGHQLLPPPSLHGQAFEQAAEGAEDAKLRYPRQHVRRHFSGCAVSPRTGSRRSSGGEDRRGSDSGGGGAPETANSPVTMAVGSPVYGAPVGGGAVLHDDSHDGDVSDGGGSSGDGVAIPVGSGCKRGKATRRSSGTLGAGGEYDGRSGVGRSAAGASAGRGTPLGGAPVHVAPPRLSVPGSDLSQSPCSHLLQLSRQPVPQSVAQQGGALHHPQGGDTVGPDNPSDAPAGPSPIPGPSAAAPGAPPDVSILISPPSCRYRYEASGCNTQPAACQEQAAPRVGAGNGQATLTGNDKLTSTAQAHVHAAPDSDVGAGPTGVLLPSLPPPLPSPPGAAEAMTCADDADARARAVAVKRFGGDCPEEVVRAMAQSAKFDAEMDDVTEQPQGAGAPRGAMLPPLPPHHQHQQALSSSPPPQQQQQLRHHQHHEHHHQHHHSRHHRLALSGHPPHSAPQPQPQPQPHQQGPQQGGSEGVGFSFPQPSAAAAAAAVHIGSQAGRAVGPAPAGPPAHGGGGGAAVGQPLSLAPAGPGGALDFESSGGHGLRSGAEAGGATLHGSPTAGISTPQAHGGVPTGEGAGAGAGASPQAPSGSGSTFAGAHTWAATAALGVSTFLRADSRRLGESSSASPSGYSSDEVGDVSGSGDAGGGGSGAVRRRRERSRVGPLGRDLLQDSDDQDDAEGYTGYRYGYGGASPLQEYGSVYESATHDDMDEHGDDEEALPLGRSNTIIRHLAGVMERNRMRASAAAAAGGQRPSGAVPPAHPQRSSNAPPPAASSGAAVRPLVGRRAAAAEAAGPRAPGGGAPGGGGGGREGGGRGDLPGADAQLRQMLQGGSAVRLGASSAGAVASRGGSSSSHAADHLAGRLHVEKAGCLAEMNPSVAPAAALTDRTATEDARACGAVDGASPTVCGSDPDPEEASCQGGEGVTAEAHDAAVTAAGVSVSGIEQLQTPFAAASALPSGSI